MGFTPSLTLGSAMPGSKWMYGTPTQSAAISESGAKANIKFKIRTPSLANKQRNQSPSQRTTAGPVRGHPRVYGSQRFLTSHKILLCSATRKKVTRCSSSYEVMNYLCPQGSVFWTCEYRRWSRHWKKLKGKTPKFMTQQQWFELW